jgi:hypothetical protein
MTDPRLARASWSDSDRDAASLGWLRAWRVARGRGGGSGSAPTWFVDADATGANTGVSWTDAFVDLRDALAAATSGDQLWVAGGPLSARRRHQGTRTSRTSRRLVSRCTAASPETKSS